MTEANGTAPIASDPPAYPRRFSWPMRLFLFILLFDIIFRSMSVLVPVADWRKELGMATLPWRLPTRAEMQELAEKEPSPEQPPALRERVLESLDDVWDYAKPWPSAKVRARMFSWEDTGKFAYCWLWTRCEFLEALAGIDEEWPMFSPNVSTRKRMVRSRLVYEDGSEQTVRLTADPEDLTRYSHWNQEKVLDYELRVLDDADNRLGYCNLLRHRHARNDRGSPLATIHLLVIKYYYPPPGVDPVAFLREQMEQDQRPDPFFVYDVKTRQGRLIEEP